MPCVRQKGIVLVQPASIKHFDRFFFGSMALSLLNLAMTIEDSFALIEQDAAILGFGSGFSFAVTLFSMAIPLLLWFLISRRASNVAKWILVVLTVIGLLLVILTFPSQVEQGILSLILVMAMNVLQIVAITFLFRRDARVWFGSKGRVGPTDSEIFS
jgi:hypothetical protein